MTQRHHRRQQIQELATTHLLHQQEPAQTESEDSDDA